MQCLTHVMRAVALVGALALSTNVMSQQREFVDELYCDGVALMAKAGAEAKQRGESLPKWQQSLKALKGYGVKSKDNVLYRVLPRVIEESSLVYKWRKTPMDTYMASFNNCMANDYGLLVSVK